MSGFKVPGFFYQADDFIKNSYSLQDIFSPITISDIENKTKYVKYETFSQLIGHCFTICSLDKWNETMAPHFYLTTKFDIKIFVHERGMEFWLKGFAEFPIDVSFVTLETNNSKGMVSAVMTLKEVDSTFLNKDEEPCRHYSKDSFVLCCKNKLWENIPSSINCTISEMNTLIPDTETVTECQNQTLASNVYWAFAFYLNKFTHRPWMFGCPVPCRQLSYKIIVENYHKNNVMLDGDKMKESKTYFTLMVYYPSLTVEERIENLEYDLVDLLALAGGNLGLLLGFSLLLTSV